MTDHSLAPDFRPVKLIGPRQRNLAKVMVDAAPDGWIVRVKEPTRTEDQNAKLWPMLTDLSKQVPWPVNGVEQYLSPDDWKDLATAALAKEQRVAAGMDGGFVFLGRKTSTMSKRTFSDLIEVIYAFGAGRNVQWSEPHPDERSAA